MKFRVTQKGVSDSKDNPVPIGTVLDVPGDKLPASLVNKGVIEDDGKTFVTNPAKKLTKAEQKTADEAAAKERAELVKSAEILGVVVTPEMSIEEINTAMSLVGQS